MTAPPVGDMIVVVNAGSSSIKLAGYLIDGDDLRLDMRGQMEILDSGPHFVAKNAIGEVLLTRAWPAEARLGHVGAMHHLLEVLPKLLQGRRIRAIGHRVVHGGIAFAAPVRVDTDMLRQLEALCPLAPLHQPFNLAPIATALRLTPELPQIACFDTAFHQSQPLVAQTFALPRAVTASGVRRYGFH